MPDFLAPLKSLARWISDRRARSGKARSPVRNRTCLQLEQLERREVLSADPILQDANSTSWYSYRDQTGAQFNNTFNALKGANIPIDIEVANNDGHIASIWMDNSAGRGWYLWRNLTSADFGGKWTQYKNLGYRLVDQETYDLGGKTLYAGIWIQNLEGRAWASRRNMSAAAYQDFFNQYSANYLPVDVDIDMAGGSLKYSAVFVQNTTNRAWIARHNLTDAQYANLFNQLKGSYRVSDFESYQTGAGQRYAVVWVQNTNGRGWAATRDMSEPAYWNNWNSMVDQGYRLVDFERYQTANGWRYAAVWRQEGDRLNWNLKSQVDALAKAQLAGLGGGVSVTVAQNGKFLYRRGFGFQDKAKGLQYSSMTVSRLASISKAVAAVLALDLVERGLLNINNTTRSYVPTMPKHHTHTLRQLLSNRAGVGHYPEMPAISGSFATALAASAKFWDKKLLFVPGTNYHYSTHGYTLLGAAIEGALGGSIQQIARQYLTNAYALGTLAVENRASANRYRANLYNAKGEVLTADDLSWKILGGGFESSGLDLARFAIKLLKGDILNASSRTDMWTAPDSYAAYGLGWDLGTTSGGNAWVAKSGSGKGAGTRIIVFPNSGIVVTVLFNSSDTQARAETLAKQIGGLLVA